MTPTPDLSFSIPSALDIGRIAARLILALVIGALVGINRERIHKPAGLRTHMLVALGTSLVVVTAVEARMSASDLSRVVQGLVTGLGFLGGGAILKLTAEREIHGLTTAASIWTTAAASIAAGLGEVATAALGVALGLVILGLLGGLERRLEDQVPPEAADPKPPGKA
ncbi:MAG TPA: MgtC/SapB family protein [Steroidobacteraceae bacterium]|nr:MgtC/SapB family protein [Steroidobacteraceae bacterium]